MEYPSQIFQTQLKGTSMEWEVIHKNFHDALNKDKAAIQQYKVVGALYNLKGILQ